MKKNESLHNLIHSLSPSEKRYFKIYTSRHAIGGENNYVKLFKLFEECKEYDDRRIEQMAKEADFVKNFPAEKNYLHHMILDCLDVYHKDSSVDRQISKYLNIGRILMEKKLDIQGAEILEKAHKLSSFHHRHENLLPIQNLLKKKDFSKETIRPDILRDYQQKELEMVEQLQLKLRYQHCFEQLLLLRRTYGFISDQDLLQDYCSRFPHLVEELKEKFESFDVAIYYWSSRLEFSRIVRDHDLGTRCSHLLISTLEQNRAKIAGEYIDRYIYTLYVFVVMRWYDSDKEANSSLYKLEHLEKFVDAKVSKNEHARCFEFYFTAITDMRLESKNYADVWNIIPRIEELFDLYEPHMTPSFILVLHYNLCCLFFCLGEYRQALKWLNKIRNVTTPFRSDIFYDIRTLNMIIHYELGNEDLLPNLIKSANYHSKKHIRSKGVQKAVIKSMKQLLKQPSGSNQKHIFTQLQEELTQLQMDPKENALFLDVDLIAWTQKRLDKSSWK